MNENLLLLNFLSRFFFFFDYLHLKISSFISEQYFTVDFYTFNLRLRLALFLCLVFSLPSNILYCVLFSFYGAPGDRTKLALDLRTQLQNDLSQNSCLIFVVFLTYNFLSQSVSRCTQCDISSGGETIIRFLLFEFVLRVFFAEDFSIKIDEILLKRKFFFFYHATLDLETS